MGERVGGRGTQRPASRSSLTLWIRADICVGPHLAVCGGRPCCTSRPSRCRRRCASATYASESKSRRPPSPPLHPPQRDPTCPAMYRRCKRSQRLLQHVDVLRFPSPPPVPPPSVPLPPACSCRRARQSQTRRSSVTDTAPHEHHEHAEAHRRRRALAHAPTGVDPASAATSAAPPQAEASDRRSKCCIARTRVALHWRMAHRAPCQCHAASCRCLPTAFPPDFFRRHCFATVSQ